MKITLRRYRLLSDFERVSQFMRLNFKSISWVVMSRSLFGSMRIHILILIIL
ncbi:hypothetical protein SAMN05216191_11212 [Paenibacillus jilunlii]|uniref:Uncharacterized protein n=1 Tax=Paenibacillus jilunlii TaxID=682956 RepID=A0A1G9SPH6_9BACL|nr:hypothetical protein SAMN05216191_11212 [Paenibacillus jilunlii]